jgi:hypothetical protein
VDGPVDVCVGNIHQAGEVEGSTSLVFGKTFSISDGKSADEESSSDYNCLIFGKAFSIGNGKKADEGSGSGYNYSWNITSDVLALFISAVALVLRLGFSLMWLALALLIAAVAPRMVESGRTLIRDTMARTFAIGLLWKLAYWLLLLVFTAASFLLIGIPFLLVLLIIQWLLVLLGLPALLLGLGRWVFHRFGRPAPSFYLAIFTGGVVVTLLRLIPFAGDVFWWAFAVLASGAAIRQLLTLRVHVAPPGPGLSPTPTASA